MGLGLIAALVAGVALLTGSRSPGRRVSDGSRSGLHYVPFTTHYLHGGNARYNAHSNHLPFGLTKQQVRRLVGPPDKALRYQALLCWQYQVNAVNSDRKSFVHNADRLCFLYGRYSQKYWQWNGAWSVY